MSLVEAGAAIRPAAPTMGARIGGGVRPPAGLQLTR
jgi:hypothetical protein